MRRTTKLTEVGHRGLQDYRHICYHFYVFLRFLRFFQNPKSRDFLRFLPCFIRFLELWVRTVHLWTLTVRDNWTISSPFTMITATQLDWDCSTDRPSNCRRNVLPRSTAFPVTWTPTRLPAEVNRCRCLCDEQMTSRTCRRRLAAMSVMMTSLAHAPSVPCLYYVITCISVMHTDDRQSATFNSSQFR